MYTETLPTGNSLPFLRFVGIKECKTNVTSVTKLLHYLSFFVYGVCYWDQPGLLSESWAKSAIEVPSKTNLKTSVDEWDSGTVCDITQSFHDKWYTVKGSQNF